MIWPWNRPGALTAALELIDDHLARAGGRVRTGEPQIVRQWSISTVLRVPTDGGPVWFKAVPAGFAHEGRLTHWVWRAVPDHAAPVLGHGEGWLLTEELATQAPQPFATALAAAARVQLASVGRGEELRALGCPERGPRQLVAELTGLASRHDLLDDEVSRALTMALPAVADTLHPLADDVPLVLVHGDVQPENVGWTGSDWALIDWTDASLGHPFAELARPLMQASREERERVETAFTAVWSQVMGPDVVRRALAAVPVLGAAHQVGNYLRIVDRIGGADGLRELLHQWLDRLLLAVAAPSVPTSAVPSARLP